jgi:hypothetical protein
LVESTIRAKTHDPPARQEDKNVKHIKARKAEAQFGNDTIDLGPVEIDPALVVSAIQSPSGEVVVNLVSEVKFTGKAARKASRALWGRHGATQVRWTTTV